MSRWIELEPLIEAMGEEPYVWNDEADEIAERNQWLTDMNIIYDAPGIDLVRCGECKWAKANGTYQWCGRLDSTARITADDFCSYGERGRVDV